MKTISVRLKDIDERRIEEIKEWYKNNLPFEWDYSTTEIIKTAINSLHYDLIVDKSNKKD